MSRGFEELTGYPATEIIGHNCRFLQGPSTDVGVKKALSAAIGAGEDISKFILNYKKDGTPFVNSVSLMALKDGNGKTVRALVCSFLLPSPSCMPNSSLCSKSN